MYTFLYIETNLICVILLMFVVHKYDASIDKQRENLAFDAVVYATLFILLLDSAWIIVDGRKSQIAFCFNYLINILYMILSVLISFLWLRFVLCKLNKQKMISRKKQILISLPVFLYVIFCISTPWAKGLFYIDTANVYHRGTYYLVQVLLSYSYAIISVLYAFLCYIKMNDYQQKVNALILCSFLILPAIGGIIGCFLFGLPLVWTFYSLSLLLVYLKFQGYQISTDGLTGLNNRRQFDKYLFQKTADLHRTNKLFLLLTDINSFKKINDTYGHIEGDRALVTTAKLLNEACNLPNAFIARYGGDEFAIVYECGSRDEVNDLKNRINDTFIKYNETANASYSLVLSIGLSEFGTQDAKTVSEFIAEADMYLYQAKHLWKLQNIE